jgi:4a-hydroxytetrahydrobiopterin dehydratase
VAKLDQNAINAALHELPEWSREHDILVRVVKCKDWRDAISLIDAVAAEAERRDHHPDLCVTRYRTVTFRLTSHDAGGITRRDVEMARAIDELTTSS